MMNSGRIRMRLLAGVALSGAALAAIPASAAVMRATYAGTIEHSSENYNGEFGLIVGETLAGMSIVFEFVYNTSDINSIQLKEPGRDEIYGGTEYGNTSPIITSRVIVNGISKWISGSYNGSAVKYSYPFTSSPIYGVNSTEFLIGKLGYNSSYSYIGAGAGNGLLSGDLSSSFDLMNVRGNGSIMFAECSFPAGCNDVGEFSAFARISSLSVETVSPSMVALPAALPLLTVAFGGLGFVARRRRARV